MIDAVRRRAMKGEVNPARGARESAGDHALPMARR